MNKKLELKLLEYWHSNHVEYIYEYKGRIKEYRSEDGSLTNFELFYPLGYDMFNDLVDIASLNGHTPISGSIKSLEELLEKRALS